MLDIGTEEDVRRTAEIVASHADDVEALKASAAAAMRVFWLKGHRDGYAEGHDDAEKDRDKRTAAHLN